MFRRDKNEKKFLRENRADPGGICVANHTSPIDVLILAQDNCYALVNERTEKILFCTLTITLCVLRSVKAMAAFWV